VLLRNALPWMMLAVAPLWGQSPLGQADFRYSPPWWQSTISLADDQDKVLVGREGQLLFDFKGPKLRDFAVQLKVETDPAGEWKRQQTESARVPIVSTWSNLAGVELNQECFMLPGKGRARRVALVLMLKNGTGRVARKRLMLSIRAPGAVQLDASQRLIQAGESTLISTTEPLTYDAASGRASLPEVELKPGEARRLIVTVDRYAETPGAAITAAELAAGRETVRRYWRERGLPFETVQVPDTAIQALIESSVRNIWQARDVTDGKVDFRVGPTVYRNLFVVDGSFMLETAALLGRAKDARDGIEFLLSHQEADGSFNLMGHYAKIQGYWKENGIVLWAMYRHARLAQDQEWLRSKWTVMKRTMDAMRRLRASTMKDPQALDYGLMPAGMIDGGINNKLPDSKPEFSNTYWNLAGWKAAIEAARWLGENETAAAWQKEYDEFLAAYRRAAARDTLKDAHGNAYVPTMMANADNHVPARGQWAFCHAVYPGAVFAPGDPLVESQLAMLRATKVEGLVFDTGWMKQGLWNYFASFYGHAVLWEGHGREAAEVLYDFARHAAPVRVWREEQKPQGQGADEVGDMPHNWASAEFIRLAAHLIALDRGDELHLLEGFPREWARAGMVTRLNGMATPFGPLHLELAVARDGRSAHLKLRRLDGPAPARIVLHTAGLTGTDEKRVLETGKDVELTLPVGDNNR